MRVDQSSAADSTTTEQHNAKQRHIKGESPRYLGSRALSSDMDFSAPFQPFLQTLPMNNRASDEQPNLPLANNSLPLWPLPFQLLVFSGKKLYSYI